jgi:tartrate-resistant acid phosphatase type 5
MLFRREIVIGLWQDKLAFYRLHSHGNRLMPSRKLLIPRRKFLAGSASALALAGLPRVAAVAKAPSLPYVVIGDWGRNGADDQREVGLQLGRTAEKIGSHFTISVGDNFYEDGVAGVDDPQWRSSFEDIYAAPSLMKPWNIILGNHDYRGNVEAQFAYAAVSPRWRLPSRYYRKTEALGGGVSADYFYLDTSPFVTAYRNSKVKIDDQQTAPQLAWLDEELGRSRAAWKIVIGHHPVYTVTGNEQNTGELIAQLKPILDRHRVHVYVNGHIHNQQHLTVDGVHYITTGAGSQTLPVPPPGSGQFTSDSHGFMTVEHSADAFRFAFLDEAGKELYRTAIARG